MQVDGPRPGRYGVLERTPLGDVTLAQHPVAHEAPRLPLAQQVREEVQHAARIHGVALRPGERPVDRQEQSVQL